jgi:hypothetical protein
LCREFCLCYSVLIFLRCLSQTILYLYAALNEKKHSKMERFCDFLNGEGTVVHHSISAFYVAMVVTGVLPASRHTVEVPLPLVIQHWFVLLKYTNHFAYCVLELLAEAWFEWVALSNLEALYMGHWTGGVLVGSMLFAHWLYFVAGTVSLFVTKENSDIDQVEHLNRIGEESRELTLANPDPPGKRRSSILLRKLSPHLSTFRIHRRRKNIVADPENEVSPREESPKSSTTLQRSSAGEEENVNPISPPAHHPSIASGLMQASLPDHSDE